MLKLYGIPNCDTVKKARDFLAKASVDYEFVDFKKTPPTLSDLERWKKAFGDWPLNKRGPTFRKHQDVFEALSESKIPAFIIQSPSMIKRPILERDARVIAFGFDPEQYGKLF